MGAGRRLAHAVGRGACALSVGAIALAAGPGALAEPIPHFNKGGILGFCSDAYDPDLRQYVIGYGNFMDETSKRNTAPTAGPTIPIRLKGYERSFSLRHGPEAGRSTLLAARPKEGAEIVAGLFEIRDVNGITRQDRHAGLSCRERISADAIEALDGSKIATGGQIWIYVPIDEVMHAASDDYPIIQSYVDLFMGGCIELAQKVTADMDFAAECLATTSDWSEHWINDRIHARRAYDTVPHAHRIDALIRASMPEIFAAIQYP